MLLEKERISIEDRVKVEGRCEGTVVFLGPILHTTGVWYGVKLDKREGKMDGRQKSTKTKKEVRYFFAQSLHGILTRSKNLSLLEYNGQITKKKKKN